MSVYRWAALLVPVLYGLFSIKQGQDLNWDLLNYHLYNPYAFLNGKIGYDLAPGQWQSYFNPTLDLLPYILNQYFPARVAGFVIGYLQGMNFVFVLILSDIILQDKKNNTVIWHRALLLACAGGMGAGFLMEIGNSMGDDLTALGVLGSMALLVIRQRVMQDGHRVGIGIVLLAGVCCGLSAGLKLTNAPYALAICIALFIFPGTFWMRLRSAFIYGCGVLAGIVASAGHWYWKMWQVFGNPLFPQFNDKFLAPLAAPIGIGDTGWLPKGWWEKFMWPFIFTLDPKRVIEIKFTQIIWPIMYVAFIALVIHTVFTMMSRTVRKPLPVASRFILLFFSLSYLIWLNLFGIYRYLIPLELLAPLVLWIIMQRLLPERIAVWVAGGIILLATCVIFPLGDWGHTAWDRKAVDVRAPVLSSPQDSIAFTVQGDPPLGWLVNGFPASLAVVSIGTGFPESPAYRTRVDAMMDKRAGPFYVILNAERPVADVALSEAERLAIAERNAAMKAAAAVTLDRYALLFDRKSGCQPFDAFVGKNRWAYELCPVIRKKTTT